MNIQTMLAFFVVNSFGVPVTPTMYIPSIDNATENCRTDMISVNAINKYAMEDGKQIIAFCEKR